VAEARSIVAGHLADHYAFYGEAAGVRIARKHLGWYAQQLAGGEAFRREINAADASRAQLDAVRRLFDRLAGAGERLDYLPRSAEVVVVRAASGRTQDQALRGGEALAA